VVKSSTDEGYPILDLTATCQGEKVLAQARATVRSLRDAPADITVPKR
jgi:hypothetical protein